mmetsp:Transcript_97755/g.134476  ORF Transcript_97755/g.134476 Transcript_97755/m.134476 type:complete len:230 (-) Transcript_97755:194-883(-)
MGRVGIIVSRSEKIIPVKVGGKLHNSSPVNIANFRTFRSKNLITIEFATGIVELSKELGWNNIHPEDSIRENGIGINMPVGDTVTNNETLKIDLLNVFVDGGLLVILINLPREVRNIDASITLTRDKEFVLLEFWEFFIPGFKSNNSVLRLLHIISVPVFLITSNRPSNTSRTFEVKNILSSVPWEWVVLDILLAIINDTRTVFVDETKHGRAARTTVEPDKNWILRWI